MPISLRLPDDIESQITGFGARQGLSKSAVIVRSIQEFLARNAQPTSFQIYEEVMREALLDASLGRAALHDRSAAEVMAAEVRPHKLQIREAIRRKHAKRVARADAALKATQAPQPEVSSTAKPRDAQKTPTARKAA